jgi:hypothetical protein
MSLITRTIAANLKEIQKMLDAKVPKNDPFSPVETVGQNSKCQFIFARENELR